MNKKVMIIVGIIIAFLMGILYIIDTVHIAVSAIVILLDFIVVYSFTTMKDRDIPEDLHDSFEEAFEDKEENKNFLENKTKTCPVCQTENEIHRKYCKKCQNIIQNITCPVCNTVNPHDAKYCSHCDSILQNKKRS